MAETTAPQLSSVSSVCPLPQGQQASAAMQQPRCVSLQQQHVPQQSPAFSLQQQYVQQSPAVSLQQQHVLQFPAVSLPQQAFQYYCYTPMMIVTSYLPCFPLTVPAASVAVAAGDYISMGNNNFSISPIHPISSRQQQQKITKKVSNIPTVNDYLDDIV